MEIKVIKHGDKEREFIYSWLKEEDSILLPVDYYHSYEDFSCSVKEIDFLISKVNEDYLFIGLIEDFILPKEMVSSDVLYISDIAFNWKFVSSEKNPDLLSEVWKSIFKLHPRIVLNTTYCGEDCLKAGFIEQFLKFSHEENEFSLSSFDLPPLCTNFGDERLVLSWIEDYNEIFEDYELEIETVSAEDFEWKTDLVPTRVLGKTSELAYGFSLFSKDYTSLSPQGTKLIIAYAVNGERRQFVGILTYEKLSVNEYKFGIIDVHKNYRQKGIATRLYRALNEQLSAEDTLWTGMITPKGRKCGIQETRNLNLTKCKVRNIASKYE